MVTAGECQGPGTVGDGLSTDELESAAIILGLVLLFMGTTDWYTDIHCRPVQGTARQGAGPAAQYASLALRLPDRAQAGAAGCRARCQCQ